MYVQFTSCVKGDDSKFLMWIGVLQWLLTLPTPSFWHDEPLLQGKQVMILVISKVLISVNHSHYSVLKGTLFL